MLLRVFRGTGIFGNNLTEDTQRQLLCRDLEWLGRTPFAVPCGGQTPILCLLRATGRKRSLTGWNELLSVQVMKHDFVSVMITLNTSLL